MTENSPRGARLDHVSDAGDLVFEAGGERFVVTVDDSLERAVLAAKQIRMESRRLRQPRANDALPISKIQQLIRAGADPSTVAERYGLNQALVRRFSASVQMEKQYAIEQFKRVPAPKESRVRTVEDLIYMTLSLARVNRDTLFWQATRRGHEPWHISATFLASGRKVRAEWTWDMHDNTVVCLNPAAKKLLGEQNLGPGDADGHRHDLTPIIEENTGSPSGRPNDGDFATPGPGNGEAPGPVPMPSDAPNPTPLVPSDSGDGNPPAAAADADGSHTSQPSQPATMGDIPVVHADPDQGNDSGNENGSGTRMPDGVAGDLPPVPNPTDADRANAAGAERGADGDGSDTENDGQPAKKRRTRRSAIPSWDQILFGE